MCRQLGNGFCLGHAANRTSISLYACVFTGRLLCDSTAVIAMCRQLGNALCFCSTTGRASIDLAALFATGRTCRNLTAVILMAVGAGGSKCIDWAVICFFADYSYKFVLIGCSGQKGIAQLVIYIVPDFKIAVIAQVNRLNLIVKLCALIVIETNAHLGNNRSIRPAHIADSGQHCIGRANGMLFRIFCPGKIGRCLCLALLTGGKIHRLRIIRIYRTASAGVAIIVRMFRPVKFKCVIIVDVI